MTVHEILMAGVASGAIETHQAFLGALIGGAVSLVGGLLGRNDQKKKDKAAAAAAKVPQITRVAHSQVQTLKSTQTQNATSTTNTGVDFKKLVKEAEAAGFNPLTVMRAGLGGAFSTQTTTQSMTATSNQRLHDKVRSTTKTTGHNAMAAVPQAPSVGSVIGNALNNGFNIYREDQQNKANQELQQKILDANLAGQQQAAPRSSSFYTPSYVTSGSAVKMGGAALSGAPVHPSYEKPTATNPYRSANIDQTVPDVSAAEERYGDLGALPFAVRNYISDLLKNVTGTTVDDRAKIRQGLVDDATAALTSSVQKAKEALNLSRAGQDIGSMVRRPAALRAPQPEVPYNNGIGGW